MLEIRIARSDDKEPIRRIYISAVGPQASWDEVYWDELMNAGGFLVALAEGQVIGFGGIDVNVSEQLRWLYLLPEYQRTGVGSKLLQRLEGIGWEAGLASLRLHSAPEAVEFYRRHGYSIVEEADQLGHDHEGVEMVKRGDVTCCE